MPKDKEYKKMLQDIFGKTTHSDHKMGGKWGFSMEVVETEVDR